MPDDPRDSYFDYRPYGKLGPRNWGDVDDSSEKKYWDDFSKFIDPSLKRSVCDSGSDRQSPIDVRFEESKGVCYEYHEIRHEVSVKSAQGRMMNVKLNRKQSWINSEDGSF